MSYTHLNAMERAKIELLRERGLSCEAIGRQLGRSPSTISRELGRNGTQAGYRAEAAQKRYEERRRACRPKGRLAYLLSEVEAYEAKRRVACSP